MGVAPFCIDLLLRMSFFVMGTVPDPQVYYNTFGMILQENL